MNDLVAVDKESFYFTNPMYNTELTKVKLEMFSLMRWGSVGYYDGATKTSKLVLEGLYAPNGINVSPDGK